MNKIQARRFCGQIKTIMLVAGFAAIAVEAQAQDRPPNGGWRTDVSAAYAWQGDADIENSGQFSVNRSVIELSTRGRTGRRLFTGVTLGYEQDDYEFSQAAGQPWDDIRTLQFGFSLRYLASEKWMFFGLPLLRYSAEKDVDLSDGREYGLLAGASYRVSDTLTLGPGFGAISGIGGEEDYFPILLIDWKISDSLSLETGRGFAASRGPGLTLKWRPASEWEFGIAARYEKSRFRLATNDNIGEDRSVPVVLTASWKPVKKIQLTAFAGSETAGKLSVENSSGDRLQELSYDSAPQAGLLIKLNF